MNVVSRALSLHPLVACIALALGASDACASPPQRITQYHRHIRRDDSAARHASVRSAARAACRQWRAHTHTCVAGWESRDRQGRGIVHRLDQRGAGYPRTIGDSPDIGAFEAPLQNQAPTAADDTYTTNENVTLTVSVPGLIANDSDPDGDVLAVVLVDDVANGSLTLNADGSLVDMPATNFFGTDSFTYEVTDGEATSNVATVTSRWSKSSTPTWCS